MKSNLHKILLLLVILVVAIAFDTVSAASASKPFGGQIVNTKATEIQSYENAGYNCIVPGSTITIRSKVSSAPITYLIPAAVKSKTNTSARAGQEIKGLYSQSKTSITCIYQGYPPRTATVQLTPITLYGTSR